MEFVSWLVFADALYEFGKRNRQTRYAITVGRSNLNGTLKLRIRDELQGSGGCIARAGSINIEQDAYGVIAESSVLCRTDDRVFVAPQKLSPVDCHVIRVVWSKEFNGNSIGRFVNWKVLAEDPGASVGCISRVKPDNGGIVRS